MQARLFFSTSANNHRGRRTYDSSPLTLAIHPRLRMSTTLQQSSPEPEDKSSPLSISKYSSA
jgi:hypothetical protein